MAKQENSASTMDRILEAAEGLFAAHGFDGVTTRQVAAASGISIQTLHYHCRTKANLYFMVVERAIVPAMEMIDTGVRRMSGLDLTGPEVFLSAMDQIVDDIFELFHAHPNYPLLYFRQFMEPDIERMRVETDRLVPVLRQWAGYGDTVVNRPGKGRVDVLLLLLQLSPMYASLFVNSNFISNVLGMNKDSAAYLERLKNHAKNMTRKMMGY